jgi:segregation and condensation protein B
MPSQIEVKRILEAALLASQEPLSLADMKRVFDGQVEPAALKEALEELGRDWQGKSVELAQVASGWRFQTRPDFLPFIERLEPESSPRYSRAVMETLAIIAYRQPVTRGDIENIRGVAVAASILQALESRGWVDIVGHRETPGRPELLATTKRFLDDLGLKSLEELPPLEEIARTVELDAKGAAQPAATTQPAANEPNAEPNAEPSAESAEPAAEAAK